MTHENPTPDDELLTRARAGDRDAAALLYRRHEALLNCDRGHDMFVRLLERDFSVRSVRNYLGAAIHVSELNVRRTEGNRRRLRGTQSHVIAEAHDHGDNHWAQGHMTVEEALERVEAAVNGLPVELRELVRLRFEGLTLREIAAQLELPDSVVKRRNERARLLLQSLLGEIEGPFRGDDPEPVELSLDERIDLLALQRELARRDA